MPTGKTRKILENLRKKSKTELEKLLREEKEKFRKLRFAIAEKKTKNVREIRKVKKMIARILTVLKQYATNQDKKTS